MVHAQLENLYRQMEGLVSLYSTLGVQFPLPPMRHWAASPDFASLLIRLVFQHRPRLVLEAGSGVSTVLLGYALRRLGAGRVISLEHSQAFMSLTEELIDLHQLGDVAEVRHAPLETVALSGGSWLWYSVREIDDIDEIDMVVVDGPPGDTQPLARYPALPILQSRLSNRALVVLDDMVRSDEQEIVKRWESEFDGYAREDYQTEKGATVLEFRAEQSV
ncbi:MAG: hypothetical protein Kow0056_09830 [Coriobacteriia bacterium]